VPSQVSKIQKVENLNLPIKYINSFVASIGIRNQYSAENVLDEDRQFILGMVWTLILRFAINDVSEEEMTAKEGLLLWAKKKVKEGSNGTVEITNFHTSWQNGMAFNALINAFRPDLLDFAKLQVGRAGRGGSDAPRSRVAHPRAPPSHPPHTLPLAASPRAPPHLPHPSLTPPSPRPPLHTAHPGAPALSAPRARRATSSTT